MNAYCSATVFQIADVDASLRFYVESLGFTKTFRFGKYAGVCYGDVQIHLCGHSPSNKRVIGQGGIYIFCDDVDGYYATLTSRGVTSQAPPQDYEYGMRDFQIEDPDGNQIAFGQESTRTGN